MLLLSCTESFLFKNWAWILTLKISFVFQFCLSECSELNKKDHLWWQDNDDRASQSAEILGGPGACSPLCPAAEGVQEETELEKVWVEQKGAA